MAKRWSANHDRALYTGLGSFGVTWFQQRVGKSYEYPGSPARSSDAIKGRIRRLCGGGGLGRGAYTFESLIRDSGYTRSQLLRAQEALNQKWKRTKRRGRYIITEEQAEDLFEWLKHDFFDRKRRLYGCVQCGEKDGRPGGLGMCDRCARRVRRALRSAGIPSTEKSLVEFLEREAGRRGGEEREFLDEVLRNLREGRGPRWAQVRKIGRIVRSTSP